MSQLSSTISHFWNTIQASLFPWLQEELLPLTEKQRKLIAILEMMRIEEFIPATYRWMGRPTASRKAIARAFIAKCLYNLPTTRALYQHLETDINLRRICGWELRQEIPSESTFSRAFKEFTEAELPQKVHEALIKVAFKDEIIGHISRDSTPVEGREKPTYKKNLEKSTSSDEVKSLQKKKNGRGRPKKGEKMEVKDPHTYSKASKRAEFRGNDQRLTPKVR